MGNFLDLPGDFEDPTALGFGGEGFFSQAQARHLTGRKSRHPQQSRIS